MKKVICTCLTAIIVFGLGATAMAHTPGIDKRERQQRLRIRQGVRNGELTRRETRRLGLEQVRLRGYESRAKADGQVTRRERLRLNRSLNRTSRHIYRQKHDRQDRNP